MSDESFEQLRAIERRQVLENLSIIRVGDFSDFVSKIKEIEENKN